MAERTAVVVGAGISGLVAARTLAAESGLRVRVLEGSGRLGGKLARTTYEAPAGSDGAESLALDVGAESMLARRPEGVALIDELGLADRRVAPTAAKAQVLIGGEIRRLPTSAMGVPTDLAALAGYLSADGLARARTEPDRPAPPLATDVGIGAYVAERFGAEVTDRLLEPLLGGVYAGRSREFSFAAVNPALWARASAGGSLLAAAAGLAARRPAAAVDTPVFAGLDGGVTGLIDALAGDLRARGVRIDCGSPVVGLGPRPGGGFVLDVGGSDREKVEADAVMLAVPAPASARLLAEVVVEAARELAEIPYASVAVLSLIVRGAELTGSGLLVPPGELPTVKALTYAHNKWTWVAERAERRFGGPVGVVRASVGRYGEAETLQVPDDALLARTLRELSGVPGWAEAEVIESRVQRWGGGLPQYLVGHPDRARRIREAVAGRGGLALAGAYLDGPGLPACIASGLAARRCLAVG